MERVILTRDRFYDTAVCGLLVAKGELYFTAELPWRENLPRVSCIPVGEYECEYADATATHKNVYRVKGVPDRSGILMHTGNSPATDSKGCILLGCGRNSDPADPRVVNSRIAMGNFIKLMNREPFTLVIENLHDRGAV